MIKRTHLAIGAFFALFFLPYVVNKFTFVVVTLIASLLPDIDSATSTLGRSKLFRPLQFFIKHRGFIHSLTFCFAVAVIFSFYIPVLALPFFLGYSIHLFADSFTLEGIKPFWPSKVEVRGRLRTGGNVEDGIFLVFVLIDFVLVVSLFLA